MSRRSLARTVMVSTLALTVAAADAFGQAPTDSLLAVACPPGSGLVVRTDVGAPAMDSARAGSMQTPTRPATPDRALPVDTTFTFDIAERTWTRSYFAASLALGLGEEAGTTAATSRGPWRACVGAAVLMLRPTITLRGVSGRVRLRADAGALTSAGRRTTQPRTDSTASPRR
jgi:hypothetical protein